MPTHSPIPRLGRSFRDAASRVAPALRTLPALSAMTALLAAGASVGCSLVADPSSYSLDRGCDLNLGLLGFDIPHKGMSLVVQIDAPDPDTSVGFQLAGLARIDGIPDGQMRLQIPLGVPTSAAQLDFYVDNSQPSPEALYNPLGPSGTGQGDHSWTIRQPCRRDYNEFTHIANFDNFAVTPGLDEDLVFELRGFDVAAANVQFRVLQYDPSLDAIDGDGDGRYTRAFLHVTDASSTAQVYVANPLRNMLDRGANFDVELWIDHDGDQAVHDTSTQNDPADEGFVFRFSVAGGGGTFAIPQPGDGGVLPDDGHIVLDRAVVGSDDHSGWVGLLIVP